MRSGYLRNGKLYDDGHTRKSWSYWFMDQAGQRRHNRQFARMWREINAMIDASPTTAGGLVIVDDAGEVTEDHWRATRHD